MGEVLVQRDPKGVVVRVSVAVHLIDIAERTGWMRRGALRRQNGARGRKGWEWPRRAVNAIRNERLIDVLTPELTEIGTAKGGVPLKPTTILVVGSWVRMA